MHKKRNLVIFCLLGVIILVCVVQRTSIFSTAYAPSMTESEPAFEEELPAVEMTVEEELEELSVPTAPIAQPAPVVAKKCYVTGCSSQLCSSEQGMMSTCEYREEYACYQTATCEVQSDGECGWTQSEELSSCLMNSGSQSEATVELAI